MNCTRDELLLCLKCQAHKEFVSCDDCGYQTYSPGCTIWMSEDALEYIQKLEEMIANGQQRESH